MRLSVGRALLVAGAGWGCQAQTNPTFEVASIKSIDPASGVLGGTSYPGGGFNGVGTLRALIGLAYSVQDYQVSGGESWANSARYDIRARSERPANRDQINLMLRSLLAERFNLTFHHETKQLASYALVISQKGSKLHSGEARGTSSGPGRIKGVMSVSDLARNLVPTLGRPVLDRTGLTGSFDINLEWTPFQSQPGAPPAEFSGPSIFAAVQEQLGLTLESTTGSVDILVIDHAESPSPN